MFSQQEKIQIAAAVEKILLDLKHPEMPMEKPLFVLNVDGKEKWSWARIMSNWTFNKENPPGINPFTAAYMKYLLLLFMVVLLVQCAYFKGPWPEPRPDCQNAYMTHLPCVVGGQDCACAR